MLWVKADCSISCAGDKLQDAGLRWHTSWPAPCEPQHEATQSTTEAPHIVSMEPQHEATQSTTEAPHIMSMEPLRAPQKPLTLS